MKKTMIMAGIILLLSFWLCLPANAYYESADGEYEYSLLGEDATIIEYLGSGGAVSIPSTIDGYTVVGIASKAFADCEEVTSITIPNTVTSIGTKAFSGTSISSLTIPDSVTTLNGMIIEGTNVSTITIPNSVTGCGIYNRKGPLAGAEQLVSVKFLSGRTEIPANVCRGASMISVTIPDSVTTIVEYAFADGTALKTINIPKYVTEIGNHAFDSCTSLTSVTFEANESVGSETLTLGASAFSGCTSLSQITWPENLLEIGNYGFSECTSLTSVILPDGVETVGACAFQGCTNLATIELSDSLIELGYEFIKGTKVTTITIPKSLTLAGSMTYSGTGRFGPLGNAEYLKTVIFEDGMTYIPANICCQAGITTVNIPDTVMTIGSYAFADCSEMSCELSLPNVTTIESYAFYNCELLTGFDTGDAITFAPTAAVNRNVTMGGSLLTIAAHAFDGCKNLDGEFGFSENFATIGQYAFSGCESIDAFYFAGTKPSIGAGAFTGVTADCYYRNNDSSWDGIRETPEDNQYYGTLNWTVWYDFWSIVNSSTYFGPTSEGYYITTEDLNKLLTILDPDDEEDAANLENYIRSWYNLDGNAKKKEIKRTWSGSCYGLSAWTLLLDDEIRDLDELDEDADILYDVTLNEHVESAINFYHIQQQFLQDYRDEFQALSVSEQLTIMENSVENGLTLIAFLYGNDKGHAIVGYGIEEGKWTYGEDVYYKRVLIYDCSYPDKKEECFLYYNTGEDASWYNPKWNCKCDDNELSGSASDAIFKFVLSGGEICNVVDYELGETGGSAIHSIDESGILNSASGSTYTLSWSDYSCDITGGIVKESNYEDEIYIDIPINTTTDGDTLESMLSLYLPEKDQAYKVISEDDSMKYSIFLDEYYGGIYMESSGSIVFDAKDGISVNADEETTVYLSAVYNEDDFSSEYNDLWVEAENVTELTVSKTDDGVVLESDNLENVTVTIENDGDSKEIIIESDKTDVLLKDEGDGNFEVLEDEDGDGIYDGLEVEICEHDYKTVIVQEATCEIEGLQREECVLCGEVKEDSETTIEALGHTWGSGVVTKATTSKNGKITYTCTTCKGTKETVIYYPKTITLSASSYTYSGGVKTPKVTVKGADGKTISASNYTVAYASGRKNVGKYAVKVTFKGNYSGTVTKYFNIVPKGTSISKLTKAKKAFTVKWKKQSAKMSTARITGYQIQYATNKTFTSGVKTKTVSGYSKTSKKITGLKAKATYYVRVRTYKTISGTKYYSGWSTVKTK